MLATDHQGPSYKSVLLTAFLFLLASVICYQSGLDLWLASGIYALEGGNGAHFPLARNFWLYNVLHEGGRWLVLRMYLACLLLLAATYFAARLKPFRRHLAFLSIATLVVTASVASMKHLNTLPCPNALQIFGGDRAWTSFWQLFSTDLAVGNCYPAGHASSGYAWLAIAFLAPAGSPRFYWYLLPGIGLGLLFGIAQQLRGAHFLSHDLATIAFSWFVCGSIYQLLRGTALFQWWRV